ncbi:DUF2459 domain-containing protein [uncultured Aquimarina sp.]|uniref:DUF2459 domain-containing protein n=1 Tax=uncultured Aquimarina sp. TaxID=575652 RepID=UPI002639BCB3|nr:DUF2459 domain-containing protein [uncultured Aquimarina sp.]
MQLVKKTLKYLGVALLIPITYLIVALVCSYIPVTPKTNSEEQNKSIYLATNGVHLDIVIPKNNIDSLLLRGIKREPSDYYFSFGWGDENFYINTPTWGDLTFKNALKAMFLKSSTLMHVTRYKSIHSDWVQIKISKTELDKLNSYLRSTFKTHENGMKVILENQGYSSIDDFYRAKGSYSCFKTCNSWVNLGFKESGLKSCLWTPFDFGLLRIHKN